MPPKQPTEDHDDDDEVDVSDGKTNDEDVEEEDRGDVVHPEETDENLSELADEKEDDEDAEPEEGAKPAGKIPKARFDEVNERRIRAEERARIAEEENARLRGTKKGTETDEPAKVDLKDLRKQYRAALMEGDDDKAAELEDKIAEETEARAVARATEVISEQNVKKSLQEAASAVIADYPYLDSKSAKANKEAIADTVMYRDRYMREGLSAADALLKAAEKVGKVYGPAKPAPKKKAEEVEDEEEDDATPPAKGKVSKIDELRAARIKKNAQAANSQPARLDGGVGNRGTGGKVNIEDMDDDQFRTLSEREKAKLRGDIV